MKTKTAAVTAVLMTLPMAANAALPTTVKDAITGGFSDANEAAGLIIAGLAVLFGILLVRRLLR